jgi:diguanylate cyclase (GGDEF)-like protein/PAS domain S-box-containing protein
VNDSFGHQVGDAVLAELAPRLRRVDGDADIVARLGGDEFVILLRDPHGELDEPALVERIRRIVAEPCSTIAPAVLSASVGIVEDPAGTRTPDDLLREADAAMYARKHGTTAGTTSEMTSRSLNRYRLAMDGLAGSFSVLRAVWHENRICDWQIVEANALVRAHYGSVCDEPVGSCLSELDRHADNSEFRAVYERALATRRREELETDLRLPGGLTVYRRLVVVPVDDDAVAVMTFDISAQKAAEAALRESEARSRAIVAAAADAILTVDDDGIILSFNRAAEAMFGVAAAEAIGNSYRPLVPDETRPALHRAVERPGQPAEVVLTRASGEAFYAQVGISRISAGEGGLYTVIVRDVTAQHHTEAALRTALELDDLTGLPNQRSLVERTEAALAAARESAAVVGLAFIDLDRFALVNDSLGHDAGDRLLVLVAERLARSGRAGDTIARIGGDHFAILRPRIEPDDDPTALADGVTEALRAPFRLDALHEVFVTASIGVTSSRGRESARDLLRYAHTAIHRARLQPTPSVGVFDRTMSETIASRLDLETALRRALERDEIRAYYQPIVRLDRGVIVGFEALARWHRPGHGIVPPDQFIPLAEETGLITELGACMLRRAIADCAAWQRDAPGVGVAVNVSSRQLLDGDFAGLVTELLRADGLAPELLTVEITESVMLEMIDATTETMRRIRDAGTHLALDDFGTGYSSLASLRRFPIDTLKIDRAFLHAIESDADLPVIHAMIDLAAAYDLQVVAEGIESETTRALLRAAGCTLGQGFLFARPLPLDHALMLLALESAVNRPGDRPAPARG